MGSYNNLIKGFNILLEQFHIRIIIVTRNRYICSLNRVKIINIKCTRKRKREGGDKFRLMLFLESISENTQVLVEENIKIRLSPHYLPLPQP